MAQSTAALAAAPIGQVVDTERAAYLMPTRTGVSKLTLATLDRCHSSGTTRSSWPAQRTSGQSSTPCRGRCTT